MTEHKNISEAIIGVMKEIGYVEKQRGRSLNYTYAGEAALIEALRPAMVEHGITLHVSDYLAIDYMEYKTTKGSNMFSVRLHAKVTFTHAQSGTTVIVSALGEGADVGDKAMNKAQTGCLKYALRQTFLIETGDDPDKYSSVEQAKAPEVAKRKSTKQEAEKDSAPASNQSRSWPGDIIKAVVPEYFENPPNAISVLNRLDLPDPCPVELAVKKSKMYRSERDSDKSVDDAIAKAKG